MQNAKFYFADIKLINGTNTEGVLEINEDYRWRAVCHDNFNRDAATVACRQLKLGLLVEYNQGITLSTKSLIERRHFSCRGNEERLYNCNYNFYNDYYFYYDYDYRNDIYSSGKCTVVFLKCSSKPKIQCQLWRIAFK